MRLENTFIAADGIGPTTERQLWSAGITHWTDATPDVLPGDRGDTVAAFVTEAEQRLAAQDSTFFTRRLPKESRWRLYENFRDDACFFDIETTGLDNHHHEVTTLSVYRGGETTTLVKDRNLTRSRVRDLLTSAPLLISYNGSRFDIPFLETAFDLEISTPHLDAMYPCHRLDLYGGLSGAESALNIERTQPDIGGKEAVRLWEAAERGNDTALERLIAYNREDAANLEQVMDAVTTRLHDCVFVTDSESTTE